MTISYWLDDSKGRTVSTDVVIIGGGIAGLSAAYWLQKEDPTLQILIVEKNRLGFGATGRNAGFVTCGSVEHFNRLIDKHGIAEALEIWRFSEENLRLLKSEIIQDDADSILFRQNGSFSLASAETEMLELKKSAELMEVNGIRVEILNEPAIQKRLGARNFVGGIKYVDDGSVHPIKLLNLIKERILERGDSVSFLEGAEVHRIDQAGGGERVVLTDKVQIHTQTVVFATNGYSPLLHPYFKDKIFPTRGQIMLTEPVEQFMEGPCYANFVLDYFRQLPTGQMIIGGFRQLEKDTEVGYSDHTTDKIQSSLENFLNTHIPNIQGKRITHRWSGIMGFSVDGQPLIGSIPTDSSLFFTSGCVGHGLGLAFHLGKKLVDVMYDRPIERFLSAKRFS